MRRLLAFFAALVGVLGVLAALGYVALTNTTRAWFDKDLALRSSLAVAAAHESLSRNWDAPGALARTLSDITRDERIMAAAACGADGETRATTPDYPTSFACPVLLAEMRAAGGDLTEGWSTTGQLPSGAVSLWVLGVDGASGERGAAVLVHDLSYLDRRESKTRTLLVVAFFVLGVTASALTLLGVRLVRRRWVDELTDALRTPERATSHEFHPLLRDVRALAERLAGEHQREARAGAWSPARLRATLTQHLHGERIVILANREPYIHQRVGEDVKVLHPASGLVTALEPVMRACSGTWVAHGSGSADRERVDAADRVRVPPGEESYTLRRVWLSEEEEQGYYYGFSNEGLWPLCHVAHARPIFREEDFRHYVAVNRKFADAVVAEVDRDDPIILVQDYHFALAPRMIRKQLPRATIIVFWHIPWPNAERIGISPWRDELLSGLLGASIVGFHTQQHCNNFIDSVDAFVEARIDREAQAVVQGPRRTLVRPYPISIEWPVHWLDQVPSVEDARRAIRSELGLGPDALLGVGVDRLDYTKGIEERLAAVDELLARHPELRGRFTFAQLAAPSRTKIDRYRELNERVEALAERINARWGTADYKPIALLRSHHEPVSVFTFYRAADLCYVSSLHDGMNLVAKEFVAAREDLRGVLVLSEFTGAARDLTEALIVNPYDLRQVSDALAAALRMPEDEQRERMQAMRTVVSEFNVYRWAGRMLVDAAELRRKDRITGRFRGREGA